MSSTTPGDKHELAPSPNAPVSRRWRKRVIVFGVLMILAAAGAAAARRYWHAPAVVVVPEVPDSVHDPEVRSALTTAREHVLRDPRSGPAWGELGKVFRVHGFYPQSNACFERAAQLDPENPRWPYLIGLSHLRFTTGDALPYLRSANQLAKTREHRIATRLRLAETLLERGETREAEELFRAVLQDAPGDPRAHFGLGVLVSARDDPAAIEHLEAAAASPFGHHKASALLAAAARRAGDPARAARYESAGASGPPDLPWPDPFVSEYGEREAGLSEKWRRVGEFQEEGQFAAALEVLEELAQPTPDTRTLMTMGQVLERMRNYPRAATMFRSVLRDHPDNAAAHYYLGFVLYQQGAQLWERGTRDEATRALFEEAVRELQRNTELRPDHGTAHLVKALAFRYLGRLPEAEAACREAVLISPQQANGHLTLGEILIDRGRPAEAIPCLEEAARLDPREPRVKLMLEKARAAKKP
jgi:tetratricopeptide (TPR) repeat protein